MKVVYHIWEPPHWISVGVRTLFEIDPVMGVEWDRYVADRADVEFEEDPPNLYAVCIATSNPAEIYPRRLYLSRGIYLQYWDGAWSRYVQGTTY